MSEEEYDYMSDNFLVGSSKEDIRPGIIQSRSIKRKNELEKKKEISDKMNKTKSLRTIEKETLMLGLQNPLHNTNKGFALLEKMGYKPGSSLGVTGQGITEPIPVPAIRNSREGLGVKAVLKEMRQEKKKQNKARQEKEISIQDFRSRMSEEVSEREAGIDLSKSQKSCYSLDSAKGLTEPMEEWFWPLNSFEEQEKESEDEEEDVEDLLTVQDKLEMLTFYLRKTYFYCIWCGVQYDDEKDLQQECPGPTRSDH